MKTPVPGLQAVQERPAQATKKAGAREAVVDPEVVHDAIGSPGHALPISLRSEAERTLGHSFGHMNVSHSAAAGATASYRLTHDSDGTEREARDVATRGIPAAASATPFDLGDVHVHSDERAAGAARALSARAFTVGNHIAFAEGQYSPHTNAGRGVLMHELAHVAQQRVHGATPGVIHRLTDDDQQSTAQTGGAAKQPAPKKPTVIQDTATEQTKWRDKVDKIVRAQFGLKGAGIAGRTVFVDEPTFARKLAAGDLHEKLLTIFLDYGASWTARPGQILDFNRVSYFNTRGSISSTTLPELRTFIDKGIKAGFFEGQTREYDVTTGQRFPVFRVTPGELAAEFIGGVTDIAGPRAKHEITMKAPSWVHTLVHEVCHFYIDSAYRQWADGRKDGDDFLGDGRARISQILIEGMAEYFAREVMRDNEAELGPPVPGSYDDEVAQTERIAVTQTETMLRSAYFHGNASDIEFLDAVVEEYKSTPDPLLVPHHYVHPKKKGKP
jgi:hypothetical protein